MNKEKEFFWGIDLLRLIAILNIVILHTLRRSGALQSEIIEQYNTAWLLETMAYFAVNCFGIIAGFVNYSEKEKQLRVSRIVELWTQVIFYGFLAIVLVGLSTNVRISLGDIVTACFPLLRGEYWFFSAYVGMFLLSGIINAAVRNLSNKTLIVTISLLMCGTFLELISTRLQSNDLLFTLNKGYSCLWLCFMYLIGAVLRKTKAYKRVQGKKLICGIVIAILILFSWGWMVTYHKGLDKVFIYGKGWPRLFIEYTSPTIVAMAIILVTIFANTEIGINGEKIIKFLSPGAFGVYLLNSQPLIAKHIYNSENLSFVTNYHYVKFSLLIWGTSLAFTIVAILIDKMRDKAFRILGLKKIIKMLNNIIEIK